MANKSLTFLKNGNTDFNNVLDSVLTKNEIDFTQNSNFGLDSSICVPECLTLGLNPTWNLNFGGSALQAADNAASASTLDVLTPVNSMFRLSLALARFAKQGTAVTAAQAKQIFGVTSNAGALIDMSSAVTSTNIVPATLTVNTVSGTTAANLALNDSATDLASANDQSLVIFNDYTIENTHTLTIGMNAANEMDAESCEFVVSDTAGLNNFEREAATTDLHQDVIFTASGDTKILPGSFMYFHAGNNTDVMTIKTCLRTSGGTIAITTAN
jgi:hypothetical protein|tara:strand:- start:287 stop:1099 length:813 start_codon:yes stop_codon:yes gene_type:complete